MAAVWECSAGSSNAHTLGFINIDGSESVMKNERLSFPPLFGQKRT
jgi:hypothetical protein